MRTSLAAISLVLLTCLSLRAQDTLSYAPSSKTAATSDDALFDGLPYHDSLYYYYDPRPLPSGRSVCNLGISFSLLPAPLVEQEVPAPTIDLQYKRSLNSWLAFYGSLSTNYFTNILFTGLRLNTGDDAFSFGIGDAFAFFAGYVDLGGEFDKNTAVAIANLPVMQFGHKFENVAVSLSVSASYVLYADTHIGSLEDRIRLRSRFNDIYFTLAVEQPFFGDVRVTTGLSVAFSRTPYQIWMLYNTFDQYLVIPEFMFLFQL